MFGKYGTRGTDLGGGEKCNIKIFLIMIICVNNVVRTYLLMKVIRRQAKAANVCFADPFGVRRQGKTQRHRLGFIQK